MMSVNPELKILVLGDSHVYWLVTFFGDSVGPRSCFSVGGRVTHVMTFDESRIYMNISASN